MFVMSPNEEENETIVIKFLNALTNHNLKTLASLIHNDYEIRLDQTPASGIEIEDKLTSEFKSGKKGALKRHRAAFAGFSNGKIVFKEIITKNHIVCSTKRDSYRVIFGNSSN